MEDIVLSTLHIVHFLSSILWYGFMFFIIAVIAQIGRKNNVIAILNLAQRYIVLISTLSIVSGITLILSIYNFNIIQTKSFILSQKFILIAGILSLIVYIRILQSYFMTRLNYNKSLLPSSVKRFLPKLLLLFLSITIGLMFLSSHVL